MRMILAVLIAVTAVCNGGSVSDMKREIHEKGEHKLPYRWTRVGKDPAPALILFLHGAGERGDDNEAQLTHGVGDLLAWLEKEGRSAVVIAPQCNKGVWWAELRGGFRAPGGGKLEKEPSPMIGMALEVADKLAKSEKVDPKQIYVTGLSMGGFGSFAAAAYRPDFFAAAMPVCGGGDPSTAEKMKGIPFWVFHGEADRVVPLNMSEMMVEALKKAGGSVKFRKYPDVGHDSWTTTYRDPKVWEWLFAQKKP